MSTRSISVQILADAAQFERSMSAASRSAAGLETTLSRVSRQANTSLAGLGTSAKKTEGLVTKLGHSMALWLGAPALGAGLASAIKSTQQFGAAMELLHTQANASQAEVKRMTAALQGMASSVATGPEELAKGLYHVESAGLRGKNALAALTAASKGARIGSADLEDVTNALNAVIVSGIKGSKDYEQAMGALNATVGAGDMRMQDLADAMGTGLPAKAQIFGVSLKDINAALAVYGDNNIRGAEAGTQLASAIRLMGAPSKVAAKELAGLGLSTTTLANDMRTGGLVKAVSDLKDRMDAMGLTASQQAVVLTRAFGGRQSGGILVLIDQLERLKQKEKEVGDGARSFGSDWAAYTKTSQFETQRFQAALETLRIEVGNAILPTFTEATKGLADWIDKENKSGQAAKDAKTALHDLVDVVELGAKMVKALDKVTGGLEQTLGLLVAMKLAPKLAVWADAFTSLGGSAAAGTGIAGANAKAVTLRSNLANLASIGTIVVGVDILERLIPSKVTSGGQKVLEGEGLGGLGNLPIIGPVIQAGADLGNAAATKVAGPGRAGGLPPGEASKLYTPAELAAYQAGVAGKAYPLSKLHGTVMNAYLAGRQAGGHPVQTPSSGGSSGGYTVNAGVDMTGENAMIPLALKALASSGYRVDVTSGYRTYAQQAALYARYVKSGFNTKFIAAKPGHSNHETGNAVDVYVNGKPVDQSPGALAILKKYGLVADVPGDHEHLDLKGYTTTPVDTATKAQMAALGLDGTGGAAHKKKAAIVTGAALLRNSLANAISTYAGKVSTAATAGDTAHWLRLEQADLETAEKDLRKKLDQGSAKQKAATADELTAVKKQLDGVNADLVKAKKSVADDRFASVVKSQVTKFIAGLGPATDRYRQLLVKANADTGQALIDDYKAISGNLDSQKTTLQKEISKLTGDGKDKAQKAAVAAQISRLQQLLKQVGSNIQSNIQAETNALQSAVSTLQSKVSSAWSTYSAEVVQQFEAGTNQLLANLAGDPRYFQNGALTPSEALLASMQAQDQRGSLASGISSAQQQLATDTSGGADAATLKADNDAVAAAQRQLDEYDLSIKAQQERADADRQYADAVSKLTAQRTEQENQLSKVLGQFGDGLTAGTVKISDLQGWLDGANPEGWAFGVNLADVNAVSPLVTSDFGDLSDAAGNLLTAFNALVSWVNAQTGTSTPTVTRKISAGAAARAGIGSGGAIQSQFSRAGFSAGFQGRAGIGSGGAVPFLAAGGIAVSPTLAMIGEAGPEAVIPLSRLAGTAGNGRQGPFTVVLEMDGREFARGVVPYLPGEGPSQVVRVKTS